MNAVILLATLCVSQIDQDAMRASLEARLRSFDTAAAPGPVERVAPAPVSRPVELWFYWQEKCTPCDLMKPIVDRAEADGVIVHPVDCTDKEFPNVEATPMFRFSDAETGYACHDAVVGKISEAELRAILKLPPIEEEAVALAVADAAPTPYAEVIRIIGQLQLSKDEVYADIGCGADARWCVVAAESGVQRVIGIELDPARAAAARRHVAELGLDQIEIIEGDALDVDLSDVDVATAYLYPDVLEALRPKLTGLKRFASYMHPVPGLSMSKTGNAYVWRAPVAQVQQATTTYQYPVATYGGRTYQYGYRGCGNPFCAMCNSIRSQLYGK